MKITFLLTFFVFVNAMGSVFPQSNITLSIKEATVLEVLNTIENQSNFKFFYQNEQIDVYRKVNINLTKANIEEVLTNLFPDKTVKYKVFDNNLVVLTANSAQQLQVSGTITSANDGTPIPGVNVMVKGTTIGVVTDIDGKYSITVDKPDAILSVSYVGFKSVELPVSGLTTIDIKLEEDVRNLDEVVVVGYGIEKKSLVTGSISKVRDKDLETTSLARVDQALQGKVSGVTILPSSGSPGAGMKVRIRGAGSSGVSDPLYIVDGVKIDNIDFLDPNDISSIEILKDAASSAIYGTEGANGVILITSKTGTSKKGVINYNFQTGSQTAGHVMKMMNAQQYSTYMQESGVTTVPAQTTPGTDWLDEIFETAPIQRHHLSFTGGNEISTYMVSGSYFTQDGIVGGDKAKFDRYTGRFNSDHKVNNWLKISNKVGYSHFKRSAIEETNRVRNVLASALLIDPITPVFYEGALPTHVQGYITDGQKLVKNPDGKYFGMSEFVKGEIANPLALLQLEKGKVVTDQFVGSFDVNINPFKNLTLTSRLGVDFSNEQTNSWEPTYWFSSERSKNIPTVTDSTNIWFSLQWENFANYSLSFDDHNLNFLLGFSVEEKTHKNLTTLSDGMFREDDAFSQHGTKSKDGKVTGYLDKWRMTSYFGRVYYNFKEKYLLQASLRRDGSSLLAPGKNIGYFPSFSAGWVVNKESFFSVPSISFLKLRASWGQNGSLSNLIPDQFRALIISEGLSYAGGTAAETQVLKNDDLTWEKSEQTDLGIDLRLFDDRLSVTADYFNKKTKDLLIPSTPPLSVGNSGPFANTGDVSNKGIELEISYRSSINKLKYGISFNYTKLKNEVTYINPVIANKVLGGWVGTSWYSTCFEQGQPVWYFRGYKTNGIFQNQAQINKYIADNNLTGYAPVPGDPIVVNSNGDKIISEDDYTFIGSPHPDAMYGAAINLEYMGFDFAMLVQGSIGNDILFGFNRPDRITSNKPEFFYKDRWTGDGSTNEWFKADNGNKFVYESDLMVFNGSFLKFKQIQLGYTIPANLSRKAWISKARVFVSLDDFLTITKYPGMDPEANDFRNDCQGIDRGSYPLPRKIMAGINISF